jgi:hypothetical protein
LVGTDRVPGLEQGPPLLANTREELGGDGGEVGDNSLVEEPLTLVRREQLNFGCLPNLRIVHDTTLLRRPAAESQPGSLNHTTSRSSRVAAPVHPRAPLV